LKTKKSPQIPKTRAKFDVTMFGKIVIS